MCRSTAQGGRRCGQQHPVPASSSSAWRPFGDALKAQLERPLAQAAEARRQGDTAKAAAWAPEVEAARSMAVQGLVERGLSLAEAAAAVDDVAAGWAR